MEGEPSAAVMVGRPVSTTHSVSGLRSFCGVMYRACTLIKPVLLLLPKEMPFQVVLSWSGGRFSSADGYGTSAVRLTASPTVKV
jgi:hypothetical protein